ncbi:MAG: 1-(5-phosphoribosyl)-5-[(5-phosphoribosylamino)methylideneamino]imidazole-4-carboxamide isomerase [Bacteroidota bacterium]
MKIIPAIDIIDGKAVRLKKGDYSSKTIYHSDPLEVAKSFEAHGLSNLHLVDLDGAREGKVVNRKILERICSQTSLKVDVGGGIKSIEDLEAVFQAGAKQVNIGSMAVKAPDVFSSWLERYGPSRFILSADIKEGFVAINGWKTQTAYTIDRLIALFLGKGLKTVTSTDIAKDGMLAGPSLALYQHLLKQFPSLETIASGGISNLKDLEALKELGCFGAIIGKAIYEGNISLKALGEWQQSH